MQHKVQMKRCGSLGVRAVLALETLLESYFLPVSEECLFLSRLDLDYLYKGTAAGLTQTQKLRKAFSLIICARK